ncbi:MAG: nucleoside hydrolase [Pirellulaceae bacterium]|nr:nucleoside hydrolase [Pirellulaceae bacterium]
MKRILLPLDHSFLLLTVLLLIFSCLASGGPLALAEPVPIILDADMESDVDDVGALALLHALADLGEARILAVIVSAANPHSAPCAERINAYYGRGDVPIGNVQGEPVARPSKPGQAVLRDSRYARQIAEEFPGHLARGDDAPDAVDLYRRVLAEQPDRSVVIVTIGYKTNMRDLLTSGADRHSDLNGVDLVRRKVARWVCMGGNFAKSQSEANLVWDAPASTFAIDHWPTPIVFSGWEIGAAIMTGSKLADVPADSPVRRAYELYRGQVGGTRESWDQSAVLYAVRGLGNYWSLSPPGRVSARNGVSSFQPVPAGSHTYLIKKADPKEIAAELDGLMARTPEARQQPSAGRWQSQELRRFPAKEANQGVAVDAEFFYVIDNRAIGKYRKATGERVGGWRDERDGELKHLNAGVVLGDRLTCAHSNYPSIPERGSVEIWDTATMQHVGRHRFEDPPGSLTWVDRRGDAWFACFAHYRATSDPGQTSVVRLDAQWRAAATWRFPPALVKRFGSYSASGGAFGPGGHLFVTGHDARELYVLDFPADGAELIWLNTIPISTAGQAFAWDPTEPGVLYSIDRKTSDVVVSQIAQEN